MYRRNSVEAALEDQLLERGTKTITNASVGNWLTICDENDMTDKATHAHVCLTRLPPVCWVILDTANVLLVHV